jgi:hypothetical protein
MQNLHLLTSWLHKWGANRFTGTRDSINFTGPVKMTKHSASSPDFNLRVDENTLSCFLTPSRQDAKAGSQCAHRRTTFSGDPQTMGTILSFTEDCLPPEQEYESRDALFKAINDWAAHRGYAFTTGRSTVEKMSDINHSCICSKWGFPFWWRVV